MIDPHVQRQGPDTVWLTPLAIFIVLAFLTILVWRGQVEHDRSMLASHTEDVCTQAARRLEIFAQSHLTVASIFADRWANHGERDFSRKRFEEFASVLVRKMGGYHGMTLFPPNLGHGWEIRDEGARDAVLDPALQGLLEQSLQMDDVLLSAPLPSSEGHISIRAALPLRRDAEFLGFLLVEFQARALIDECFHQRIRSEFSFIIRDGEEIIYRFAPEGVDLDQALIRADRAFLSHGREWNLSMAPRQARMATIAWSSHFPIPLLGLALSLGISLLVHLLSRRMDLYRQARDEAIREVAERVRVEGALRGSEARYRSVFDSATDGFLVLDHEGLIVEANPASCEMHGYYPGELADVSFLDLMAPDHHHLYQEFRRNLNWNKNARFDSMDMRLDGSTLDVEVRGTLFDYGNESRVLAIITDVTQRKRAEQQQVKLARKVLRAQEEERSRVSRDLHDELGQLLTALRLELGWLKKKTALPSDEAALVFKNAMDLVGKSAEELRRICRGLRPPLLDDLGLEPAVELLVNDFSDRTGIEADLDIQLSEEQTPLPQEVALCTYRILQESLTNVSRHSGARTVSISLLRRPEELMLSVYDNGRGFDMLGRGSSHGSGLTGMRERAHLVMGTLEIRSAPFQGTRIVFRTLMEDLRKKEKS